MLLGHSDHWDELPNALKIAPPSARMKGLELLRATEKALWCHGVQE